MCWFLLDIRTTAYTAWLVCADSQLPVLRSSELLFNGTGTFVMWTALMPALWAHA